MRKSKIKIKSNWVKTLEVNYIENDSDTLVVVLPGGHYNIKAPLLYYAVNIAVDMKFDVIPMEYGSQVARAYIDSESYPIIENEIIEVIKQTKSYKRIIVIAKSMGTAFIGRIKKEFDSVRGIYLTPVSKNIDRPFSKEDLYIYGTNDSCISDNDKMMLSEFHTVVVEGANHGLQVGKTQQNIMILSDVMLEIEGFLNNL